MFRMAIVPDQRHFPRLSTPNHRISTGGFRLSPFARNMPTVLGSYDTALIPEMNNGQLSRMVKAEFVRPVISYSKVEGFPFKFGEIDSKSMEIAGQ